LEHGGKRYRLQLEEPTLAAGGGKQPAGKRPTGRSAR
jgi:hypothetical protein